jgi:deoxycytidylate deaminase
MKFCARAQGLSRLDDYSDCPSVHAEFNLISEFENLVNRGIVIAEWADGGLTAYVTSPPCAACAELLSSKDYISKIIWRRGRKDAHVPDPSPVFERNGKKCEEIKR